MSLKITKKHETFYLNGEINALNYKPFINFIQFNFDIDNNVIINIDNLVEINKESFETIKELISTSVKSSKIFSIVGKGSKEIYEEYNQSIVA